MTQMAPEGISGLDAANAYPEDFERYKGEEISITNLIIELVGEDDQTIVGTLMGYTNEGKLTKGATDYVIDQIKILRAQHKFSV